MVRRTVPGTRSPWETKRPPSCPSVRVASTLRKSRLDASIPVPSAGCKLPGPSKHDQQAAVAQKLVSQWETKAKEAKSSASEPSATPHAHASCGRTESEWLQALHDAADLPARLLPLPRLKAPAAWRYEKSHRARDRRRKRWALWRIATQVAQAASFCYFGGKKESLRGPPMSLCDMDPLFRGAWCGLLREAAVLREARRDAPTGAAAFASLVKNFDQERPYGGISSPEGKYAPIVADIVAEPSVPAQCVPLLKALPLEMSEIYREERNVLRDPPPSTAELQELETLAASVGGSRAEYVRYLNRPDVVPLWSFCRDGDQASTCSFKCVWKKGRTKLRKILPCLIANAKFCDVKRKQDLGLYGGASLSCVFLPGDLWASAFDQENCFTYVELPEWWSRHLATPRVRHWEVGGRARTGLRLPSRAWIRPLYRRLPMGSTHAVDLIMAINIQLAGRSLIASRALHLDAVLASGVIKIENRDAVSEPIGIVWEFFAGSARWSVACGEQQFWYLTPVEILRDSELDIANPLFLEKVVLIARTEAIFAAHWGTPCSSLSRAVTPPWRSSEFPAGLPDLGPKAAEKVAEGNKLSSIAMSLIHLFAGVGAICSDENPAKSYHWELTCVQKCIDQCLRHQIELDYCRFGEPWKKSTKIACTHNLLSSLACQCTGDHSHIVLRGSTQRDGKSTKWTSLASAYPLELVRQWALLLAEAARAAGAAARLTVEGDPDAFAVVHLNRVGAGRDRVFDFTTVGGYSHVDDHVAFGSSPENVYAAASAWCNSLRAGGFIVESPSLPAPLTRYVGYGTSVRPPRWVVPPRTLATLSAALLHLDDLARWKVGIVHSLVGVLVWCFLLRRSLLSVFFATFQWIRDHDDERVLEPPLRVRRELRAARRLLPMAFGDLGLKVLPAVVAQDAEGESAEGLGGWGLGASFPPFEEVLQVLSEACGRGMPRASELAMSCGTLREWVGVTDSQVPDSWTSGIVPWHDLLSRAHSYREIICVYETRVLVRSLEVLAKVPFARESRALGLEDNQAVVGAWNKGRSSCWGLNQALRRRTGLELVSSIELSVSWLGTKRMPMDKLSRERVTRRTVIPEASGDVVRTAGSAQDRPDVPGAEAAGDAGLL